MLHGTIASISVLHDAATSDSVSVTDKECERSVSSVSGIDHSIRDIATCPSGMLAAEWQTAWLPAESLLDAAVPNSPFQP